MLCTHAMIHYGDGLIKGSSMAKFIIIRMHSWASTILFSCVRQAINPKRKMVRPVYSIIVNTTQKVKISFKNMKLCSFGNINVVQLKQLFLYTDHCLTYIVFNTLFRAVALHQNFAALGISFLYTDHCLTRIVFFTLYRPVALHQNFAALGISMLSNWSIFFYIETIVLPIVFLTLCMPLFYKSVIVKSSQSISLLYQFSCHNSKMQLI